MQAVRYLLAQRRFAFLICVAALSMKLVVPGGYMVSGDHGQFAITLCGGTMPATMVMDMPGMHADMTGHDQPRDHGKGQDHGKAELPCAFSGLSAAAMEAIDPLQLAALIAFILSVGLAVIVLPSPKRVAYLRPPLRGPPAYP